MNKLPEYNGFSTHIELPRQQEEEAFPDLVRDMKIGDIAIWDNSVHGHVVVMRTWNTTLDPRLVGICHPGQVWAGDLGGTHTRCRILPKGTKVTITVQ